MAEQITVFRDNAGRLHDTELSAKVGDVQVELLELVKAQVPYDRYQEITHKFVCDNSLALYTIFNRVYGGDSPLIVASADAKPPGGSPPQLAPAPVVQDPPPPSPSPAPLSQVAEAPGAGSYAAYPAPPPVPPAPLPQSPDPRLGIFGGMSLGHFKPSQVSDEGDLGHG